MPTYPFITYTILTSLSNGTFKPITAPIAASITVTTLNLVVFSSAILADTVHKRGTAVV